MFNEETCSKLLQSLNNSNQNFLLQVTPFSTKITVKNSAVKRYNKPEPKKNQSEKVEQFESLAKLEIENKFLKSEMKVAKGALEEAILAQEVLADSLKKSDTKVVELEKSLEITNHKLKQALRDFSEKAAANRLFYEANLRELKEFKVLKKRRQRNLKRKLEEKPENKKSEHYQKL